MKRRAVSQPSSSRWAGAALAAAFVTAPVLAWAQDAPAPAQPAPAQPAAPPAEGEAAPTPPPPARSYPPPPPRYQNTPPPNYPSAPPQTYPSAPPQTYQPAPPPWQSSVNRGSPWGYHPAQQLEGVYRPFSFTIGAGPGSLMGGAKGEREGFALGLSYNLFRLGFGLAPNVQFTVAFEGMGRNAVSVANGEDSWLKQESWLLGMQYHILSRFYFRGSVGAAFISEHTESRTFENDSTGISLAGALGFELLQSRHAALAFDLNGSVTQYPGETWETLGMNLALSFF